MESRHILGTPENRAFLEDIAADLLRFGSRFPSPGGSAYYLAGDGAPLTDRPRETYETARMAHAYAIGHMLGVPGSAELTDKALRGLDEAEDREAGGWFSSLAPDGQPAAGKEAYAHAFVILAASSALTAGRPGAGELLQRALDVFLDKFWDDEADMVYDRWDSEFSTLDPYRGLNANMHTVEALLAAADALDNQSLRARAGRIIERVAATAREYGYRLPEHYSEQWDPILGYNADRPDDPFRPYGVTPGHGFEWSRLIVQWASQEGRLSEYLPAAERLFARAAADGWAPDGSGGIVYTTDWDGSPVVSDRMHWTLAEAIGAAAALHEATGSEEYARWYRIFMKYLDETVMDHETGSWIHQLSPDGTTMTTVWPGKPDIYHALQASLIPLHGANRSLAAILKDAQAGGNGPLAECSRTL